MQVTLVSSDAEQFKVDKEVAERSVLIKNMLEGKYNALCPAVPLFRPQLALFSAKTRP